jgi:RNA recognition motif-containing protein
MNIYVGNLSNDVTEEDLMNLFSPFGQVKEAKVIRDMFSQDSRGFGFVEMPGQTEAQSAIKDLNNQNLKGKNIVVNEARPRRNGGDRGGRGRGGSGGGGRNFNRGGGRGGR